MVKYLEAAECICLAISVCNLIAVSFAMKKQKPINKIMYFVNNLGIVVLSNLIVWTEGCYVDEKLEFKVIEFNKAAKRIIVSHSRVFEDAQKSEEKAKKNAEEKSTKKAVKQVKEKLEKTTLGDITELAALKEQMTADAAAAKEENKD